MTKTDRRCYKLLRLLRNHYSERSINVEKSRLYNENKKDVYIEVYQDIINLLDGLMEVEKEYIEFMEKTE